MNIAYIRVSHIESLNGTSLDTQEKRCKAFAELHGFKIDKVYSEIVSGGVEFRKRKIFQKVLKEIFENTDLLIAVHSEDEKIINKNLTLFKSKFGDKIPFDCHSKIRSEEACLKSTKKITGTHGWSTRFSIIIFMLLEL